jgi:hypothetical protein
MSDTSCRMCGRAFSAPSFGGPGICSACDCGAYDPAVLLSHIQRLQTRLETCTLERDVARALCREAAAGGTDEIDDEWLQKETRWATWNGDDFQCIDLSAAKEMLRRIRELQARYCIK